MTSASTATRHSATTNCRALHAISCAPKLLYKHPSGVYFGPNIEWVPQAYFVDSANTLTTEPYFLWGLKLGYDDGKRYSAYIEARNLANKAYIASASVIDRATPGIPLFEPGNGRAVYAGVRARW